MKNLFVLFAVLILISSNITYGALKPDLDLLASQVPEMSKADVEKVSRFLPASLLVHVSDTDEDIYVRLEKDGKVKIYDELKKVDIKIITTEAVYREFLSANGFDQEKFLKYVNDQKIEVEPRSYRSKILFKLLEDKFGVRINYKKSFTDSFFVFLPAKFMGMFMK